MDAGVDRRVSDDIWVDVGATIECVLGAGVWGRSRGLDFVVQPAQARTLFSDSGTALDGIPSVHAPIST